MFHQIFYLYLQLIYFIRNLLKIEHLGFLDTLKFHLCEKNYYYCYSYKNKYYIHLNQNSGSQHEA
jgi:hypothetical protein